MLAGRFICTKTCFLDVVVQQPASVELTANVTKTTDVTRIAIDRKNN